MAGQASCLPCTTPSSAQGYRHSPWHLTSVCAGDLVSCPHAPAAVTLPTNPALHPLPPAFCSSTLPSPQDSLLPQEVWSGAPVWRMEDNSVESEGGPFSPPPLCGFQGSNSGLQAAWRALRPPSHLAGPLTHSFPKDHLDRCGALPGAS